MISAEPSLQRCYFECIHLCINKPSLKSIIIKKCEGVLSSSARICTSTCEFMDRTPHIAEEQLVMTKDKAQETKLQKIHKLAFRCFLLTSTKAKKFQDGDRSIRLYSRALVWLATPFTRGGRVWCHTVSVFVLAAEFLQ